MTEVRDPQAWSRLGQKIREAREAQGYSRKRLSELAGVSEKSIQVAEEGRTPRARWPQSLTLIEDGLGWARGSMQHVLDGGEPSIAPIADLPLFEVADDGEVIGGAELSDPVDLLKRRPSTYTRSVILAQLPRQVRAGIGDVFRFGRRAHDYGASMDLVEEYERVVEALILDLAANGRGYEPAFESGQLSDWERAQKMDPLLRKIKSERETAAERRRRAMLIDMLQSADREDVTDRDNVVVGGIDSVTVLAELRKLAAEVADLSQEVRQGRGTKDDEGND
ncbi:helix-turn-helix protein [Streptomyces sp. KhCrAH-43]|uniref:helix-turn-helix domain-containing protein n=1 Tax=unclassified Streptomyces TaxID=2593676 RepID=UPI0003739F89|nr:helix-turn-helix domain-containing protein [Streptomyces sp. KhCrAH-43]MYS34891.1 helix-turn-helix domain-containing protein [Streptomyces sp. SID4920]MYX65332.1 helix-turn-helix domain-containing protein [Streptomyces sp. SID8373]RAJ64694.1 helix-turn-helix protein [Streptomyces sp. KhCrAH-43]